MGSSSGNSTIWIEVLHEGGNSPEGGGGICNEKSTREKKKCLQWVWKFSSRSGGKSKKFIIEGEHRNKT